MLSNNRNTMTAGAKPEESVLMTWASEEYHSRSRHQVQQIPNAKLAPLEVCPECKYSLQGLPPRYCCPECGFEYDEDTFCWKYPGSKPATIVWLVIVSVAFFALMATSQSLNIARWIYQVVFLVLAIVILASRLYRQWTRRSILVTAPGGVMFRETSGESMVIPNETIDWICVDGPGSDRCVIHASAGAKLAHDLTCYVKPNASQFCSVVQRRIDATREKKATI